MQLFLSCWSHGLQVCCLGSSFGSTVLEFRWTDLSPDSASRAAPRRNMVDCRFDLECVPYLFGHQHPWSAWSIPAIIISYECSKMSDSLPQTHDYPIFNKVQHEEGLLRHFFHSWTKPTYQLISYQLTTGWKRHPSSVLSRLLHFLLLLNKAHLATVFEVSCGVAFIVYFLKNL